MKTKTVFVRNLSALWTVIALAGCAPTGPARFQLAEDVEKPSRNAVIIFADGMDVQRLHEMLDAGLLPNIRRTFVEGGVQVRDAICSIPSVTYPNNSSIMTGVFPGHHGIMGNFWFERSRLLTRYYMTLDTARDVNDHLARPTIYDILADRMTVSILAQTHKGVTVSLDLKDVFDWGWILGRYTGVDARVGESITDVFAIANRVRRWPTLLLTYYPGVDETGHRHGTNSPEYAAALENVDDQVGRITKAIATAGLTGSTYFVLIADHGMVPIKPGQDFPFIRWLETERKLRVLNQPLAGSNYVDRFEAIQAYDAVASVDAGRVAMVHLPGRRGWNERPQPQDVRAWAHLEPAVHELPAVHMVACRDGENRVRAWSRDGSLAVERRIENGRRLYRMAEYEGDPLACLSASGGPLVPRAACLPVQALGGMPPVAPGDAELVRFISAGWHESREWLAATASARHPDLVPQIVELFDSPRTGDLVVFAADGWLLYPNEYAGHGSTLYRDMHVPMFFTGPDLPPGTQIPLARLVDLVPTMLGLLGESKRLEAFPPIDGINLSAELRQARPVAAPTFAPTPPRPVPRS